MFNRKAGFISRHSDVGPASTSDLCLSEIYDHLRVRPSLYQLCAHIVDMCGMNDYHIANMLPVGIPL